MKVRTRAVAALAATGALAAGVVGCGSDGQSTAAAQQGAAPTQQQSQQGASQQQGTPPGLSTLASALGVTEAKLQSAMESTRPTDPSSGPPSASEMATDLAKALNLDVDKVKAALEDNLPSGGAPPSGQQPPAASSSTSTS